MITLPKTKFREVVQQAVDEAVSQVVERWKKSETEKLEAKDVEIAAVQVSLRSSQDELFWWKIGAAVAGASAVVAFIGGIYLGVQITK
jgi:hypothetical protein